MDFSYFLDILDIEILGQRTGDLLAFIAWVLAGLLAGQYLEKFFRRMAKRFLGEKRLIAYSVAKALGKSIALLCIVTGISIALPRLEFGPQPGEVDLPEAVNQETAELAMEQAMEQGTFAANISTITTALYIMAITYMLYCLVDVLGAFMRRSFTERGSTLHETIVPLTVKIVRGIVIILGLLTIIQTVSDFQITALLAGLGVGGLAVALAAQETIRNFFGALMLVGDRPFEVGERVVVDGFDGPVESVGMRSTRIRTLEGHLITIPNGEMANKSIHNIGRRPYIRRLSTIGVTYDTSPDKVKEAIGIVEDILKDHEGMNEEFPPRVFFNGFGDFSLNILMIYWYHPPAYWDYMAFSQRVNLEILDRFNAAGIEFAFPSQTLYHQLNAEGGNRDFLRQMSEEFGQSVPGADKE